MDSGFCLFFKWKYAHSKTSTQFHECRILKLVNSLEHSKKATKFLEDYECVDLVTSRGHKEFDPNRCSCIGRVRRILMNTVST